MFGAKPLSGPILPYWYFDAMKYFSDIVDEIKTYPFKLMHMQMTSGNWRSFCLDLNVSTRPFGNEATTNSIISQDER